MRVKAPMTHATLPFPVSTIESRCKCTRFHRAPPVCRPHALGRFTVRECKEEKRREREDEGMKEGIYVRGLAKENVLHTPTVDRCEDAGIGGHKSRAHVQLAKNAPRAL